MQKLYEARDRIEAQFLRDFLEQHHIAADVFDDYLAGAAGELPAMIFPTVWVLEDRDLVRARQLLAEFLTRPRGQNRKGRWKCAGCGELVDAEFDLCWNCGAARPE
jgi:hypothetical protein